MTRTLSPRPAPAPDRTRPAPAAPGAAPGRRPRATTLGTGASRAAAPGAGPPDGNSLGAGAPEAGALGAAECLALVAAGAAFPLAFAPHDLVPLALAAPGVVAAVAARRAARGASAWASARAGALAGAAAGLAALAWMVPTLAEYGRAAALGAYLGLSLFGGAFFGLGAAVTHALLAPPAAGAAGGRRLPRVPLPLAAALGWTAQETLYAHAGDLGVPWLPAGLPLAAWPTLAQAADLGGVRLLSFAVALAAGLLASAAAERTPRRRWAAVAGAAGVFAALAGYGAWRERALAPRLAAAPRARVVVVQPNVSHAESREAGRERAWVGRAMAGTRAWAAGRAPGAPPPDLVVWPEGALPGLLPDFPDWRDSLRAAARAAGAPVLAGGLDLELRPGGRFGLYNAAWLTDAAGALDPGRAYRKQVLVPLVEATPYAALLPWVNADALGYARGGRRPPLALARRAGPALPLGVVICYESAFPELARAARADGAALLVVLTNDAWFDRTAATAQHFAHLAVRAIETRSAVVQAANTGPSALADPLGRTHGRSASGRAGAFAYEAPLLGGRSPYVRLGDWPGWASVAAGALALGARGRRGRRRR